MRLDSQRHPGRYHKRLNYRYYKRGYDVPATRAVWGDATRANAVPESAFPAETTITASDSTNAGRLAGLGFVANPQSGWTSGQKMTVGAYAFNWSGVTWAAGAHA